MLYSYQAQLNGTQLIWIDTPPVKLERQNVVVVIEHPESSHTTAVLQNRSAGFARARGCLGHHGVVGRDRLLADLSAMREDWSHPALNGASPSARGV